MKSFLSKKYNREEFLSFLAKNFLPIDFKQSQETVKIDISNSKIQNAVKLGVCESLDLSVYEFKHISSKDPRVSLSRECFSILGKHDYEPNALAVFYNEDASQWRLSLITSDYVPGKKKGRVKQEISNPRRLSYLVGEECKHKTPEKFLLGLGKIKAQTRKNKTYSAIEDLIYRFSVEILTKEFYDRLFDWYEWALEIVEFPIGMGRDVSLKKDYNEMHLIRLITRLIFVWFIKQKDLIPDWLFDEEELNSVLKNFNPASVKTGDYYNGILQNRVWSDKAYCRREKGDKRKNSVLRDRNKKRLIKFGQVPP